MDAIEILYQDESLIAVNKPSGLIVHRTKESSDRVYLLQTLGRQVDKYLYPVHRLDRASSGIILFALSSEDAKLLQEEICHKEASKKYFALVRGSTPQEWEMTRPLSNDAKVKQNAHTSFRKIAEFSRCSLLIAEIYTGRRHQIRRHLNHCAHQILGDTTYGKGKINTFFRENYQLPRLFLHAFSLEIKHPRSKEPLQIKAPLFQDLREFLLRLPDCDPALVESL